jgi:CheY-like chemotaxis protein
LRPFQEAETLRDPEREVTRLLADVATELIKLIPTVLWALVAVWIILLFKDPIRMQVLPRLTGVKAFGVEFSLAREELNRAAKDAEKTAREAERTLPKRELERATATAGLDYIATPEQLSQVLRRAEAVIPALQPGARILWVDDHPENNANERRMLESLRIAVNEALSTDQALSRLEQSPYDAVISDMSRNGDVQAGLRLLSEMRGKGIDAPVIFYVGLIDPSTGTPPGAFGITFRPDELLHYVLDSLERRRL